MTESSEPSPEPVPEPAESRTAWPFVAAVVVIAVIALGIVIAGLLSPAEENVTESDRIRVAVNNYVAARDSGDANQLKAATCTNFDADRSPLSDAPGKVTVKRVEAATVDGDRAEADVTVAHDDKDDPATSWSFARADGEWRVCNPV